MMPRLELKNRLKYDAKRNKIVDEKIPFYVDKFNSSLSLSCKVFPIFVVPRI